MKVIGLDLSLTSTGVASIVPEAPTAAVACVDRIQTKPGGSDLASRRVRLHVIGDAVCDWALGPRTDLVVVEGLAFASTSPHATERAGLWWLVVDRLIGAGLPVAIVPPTSRAKYATGRGNASKDHVLAAVIRRYPDVDVTGNDEADALALAAMGARWLGSPIERAILPKTHLDAMGKVAWPDIEGPAVPDVDVERR